MFTLIPLAMIGIGVIAWCLFVGATLAFPIALGIVTGISAHALGLPPEAAFGIGASTFVIVIALGRFAALAFPKPALRMPLIAIFAIPAAIAGYSVASAFSSLAGFASIGVSLVAAVACGAVAAHRLVRLIRFSKQIRF